MILVMLVPVVFGAPQPMIHITWAAIEPSQRVALERQFRLSEPERRHDSVWSYVPLDVTTATLRALVEHPAVVDTDGVDRRAMTIASRPPLTPRRGGLFPGAPRWAARAVQLAAAMLGLLGACALAVGVVQYTGIRPGTAAGTARRWFAIAVAGSARVVISPVFVYSAILVFVIAFRVLTLDYFENDHFTYLTFGYQLARGDLPVRDFDDPGFPLMILLSAAAMWIGGFNLLPEAVLTTAMLGIAACVTWRAASLATGGHRLLALMAVGLQVLASPRLYGYPKIVVAACAVLAFFAYHRRPVRGRLVLLAAVAAIGFLLRHDLAVYVSIGAATLLVCRNGAGRALMRPLALYAAAAVGFVLPYVIYLFSVDIGSHVSSAVGFSRAEAARTVGWVSVLQSGSALSFVVIALPVATLLWLLVQRARRGRWDADAPALAATAVLLAVIDAALLRDSTPSRIADVFGAAPILAAWLAAKTLDSAEAIRPAALRAAGVVSVWTLAAALLIATGRLGQFSHKLAEGRVADGWRGVSSHAARQVDYLRTWPWVGMLQGVSREPLVRYLDSCTRPDQRILVVGYLPELPFFARRKFAGGHSWLLPGYFTSASEQRRVAQWLAEAPPAVIVIEPANVSNLAGEWPAIAAILNNYRDAQEFDTLEVRSLRTLAEHGIDAATGLACLADP